MSRLYHLTSWHSDKKSEQCHVKQNCNLYRKNELKKFIEREIFGMFNKIHTEEDLLMELKKRDHLNDIPLCVKKYFGLEDADEC